MSSTILEFLEPSAVILDLDAANPREVIDRLGARLLEADYVEDTFVEAALDRESRLPTGLPLAGDVNAAIPHTGIEHVKRPGLAMATLNQPVVFKNMVKPDEDVPVRLVFVMALDQPEVQIEMLQEIADVLQNVETVEKLMKASSYEEVKEAFAAV